MATQNIVSVSGGKDSTATLLVAIALEAENLRAVFADTGNEHQQTYDYLDYLEAATGVSITRVKADFAQQIAGKRRFIETKWREKGVAEQVVVAALEVLQPTGNPFLGLPRKPQRWTMEWLVKTPDGKTHVDNSRTIQRATYEEVNAIMGAIIDDIKAEIGDLATFISYRLTCHGGTKKHRKGGKRRGRA